MKYKQWNCFYIFLLSVICWPSNANAQAERQKAMYMEDVDKVNDLTLDSLEKVRQSRVVPGSTRRGDHPVLFLVGNSTMRNGTLGNGNNGQWGWGYFAEDFFDKEKGTVAR